MLLEGVYMSFSKEIEDGITNASLSLVDGYVEFN